MVAGQIPFVIMCEKDLQNAPPDQDPIADPFVRVEPSGLAG
jgi:hypothetical protein